jgi:nitrous oxide reductase accessory protein NosL
MKKIILTTVSATALFLALSSCQCNKENVNPEPETATTAEQQYICPMDCENGKTYEKAGSCPVCGMDLAKK